MGMLQDVADRRERFESLAAEVYEPLQRYVRRRIHRDAADDIVAETMLTLWRRLDVVPPDARLLWAYGVARRHLANQRRAAGRRARLASRIEAEPTSTFETDHPYDAELQAALSDLSDTDRELLRLWAWERLEPAEMGPVLGITANAAAIRLHRAKKKLGRNLETARKNEGLAGHSKAVSQKEDRS
jgi:RNA polymerase sigma-70 factor, ECF subfamily